MQTPASDMPSPEPPRENDQRALLEKRSSRREKRSKNAVIFREIALIAALCVVLMAFKFDWGHPQSKMKVEAPPVEDIVLRPTPVVPEPPTQQQPERRPQQPDVPKNVSPKEVTDEAVPDEPIMRDLKPIELPNSPAENPARPASQNAIEAPAQKVFTEGTADRNAAMQGRIAVRYPRAARRANIEGRVILQFVVDERGRLQDIEVLRSPSDLLSEAAVEALREKTFTPAMQNGRPVKMRMSQPVTFRLN